MILHTDAAPPFMKNGFVVACPRTREAVYIDPGDEVARLLAVIARERLDVRHILLTHAHVDHVSGLPQAKQTLGAPIWLHRDDAFLYDAAVTQGAMFGLRIDPLPPVDRWFAATGRDVEVRIGDLEVRVHHTPGHAPGGVCLEIGPAGQRGELFVGDTLFAGSIGRTDLPGGNYEVLMQAITDVLLPVGDAAIVRPGHGPDTTIGRERATNPFLLEWMARNRS